MSFYGDMENTSVVNSDLTLKAKAKDSKFVLEDTSRSRTKVKDNQQCNTQQLAANNRWRGKNRCVTGQTTADKISHSDFLLNS